MLYCRCVNDTPGLSLDSCSSSSDAKQVWCANSLFAPSTSSPLTIFAKNMLVALLVYSNTDWKSEIGVARQQPKLCCHFFASSDCCSQQNTPLSIVPKHHQGLFLARLLRMYTFRSIRKTPSTTTAPQTSCSDHDQPLLLASSMPTVLTVMPGDEWR